MLTLFTSHTEGLPPAVSRCLQVILIVYHLMFHAVDRSVWRLLTSTSTLMHAAKTVQDSVLLKKEQIWCP